MQASDALPPRRDSEALPSLGGFRGSQHTAKTIGVLSLILLFAALVRFSGIGFLLPYHAEPDKHLVAQARQLRESSPPQYPAYGAYPHLLPTLLAAIPKPASATPDQAPQQHLEACSAEFLLGRLLMALLGTATVLVTYALARHFLRPPLALLAAALLATSLLHLLYSNQARPHVGAAFFINLALLGAVRLRLRPSLPALIVAFVSFTLAASSLQTGVFLIPAVAWGVWTFLRNGQSRRRVRWIAVLGCSAMTCVAVGWFYPFLMGKPVHAATTTPIGSLQFPHHLHWSDFNFGGATQVTRHLWEHDPVLSLLGLVGIGIALHRAVRHFELPGIAARVILCFVIPYLLVLSLWENTWARLLQPVLPALCVLSAGACGTLAQLVARSSAAPNRALPAFCYLALAIPFATSTKFAYLKLKPDSLSECGEWMTAQVEKESDVLVATTPWLSLPIPRKFSSRESRADLLNSPLRLPWEKYQARREFLPHAESGISAVPIHPEGKWPTALSQVATKVDYSAVLADLAPDYAIVVQSPESVTKVERAARTWGRPIAHFGSCPHDAWHPGFRWPYQCANTFASVWQARQLGPSVTVYTPRILVDRGSTQ